MARTRGGACSVRPSAGPGQCHFLAWRCVTVSHGLLISSGKLGRATAAPFLLPHPCTSSAERATFPRRHRGGPGPSAAAHQGCLWGDTGGAGPASLLGVPRAHSPRVRIPAASWGPATGVSRRGVQAGSSGHVSHHPHSQQVCAAPQIYLVQVPPSSWQGD